MVKINFQNNITKANADTFNTMQDNIEDAIQEENILLTNYVDNKLAYSTDETVVGKWIDNRPLYRKVFTYTNLSQISSGNYGTISTGLANTTRIVKVEGLNTNSSLGITRALPYTDNTNLLRIITTSNGAEIRLYVNGSLFTANDDATVILYYIKTTD